MNNYGMNVRIKFKQDSPFKGVEEMRYNVTEIHYCYPSALAEKSVAFESDIHGTGGTLHVAAIEEFEAIIAEKIEDSY